MNAPSPPGASGATVSVIVPTYNRAGYINECIDSLLAQTVPALEILVIDDGSEDDTPSRLARYGNRIRYVRKENGGKAAAVNLGIGLAQGEWIWVFDDDDVALPKANESRLAVLLDNPEASFTYSPHYLGFDSATGVIERGALNMPAIVPHSGFLLEIARSCFFHLGTALVKRQSYLEAGGFDTAMVRGQDYDFQIRLARIARSVFCPEPIFVFRQHPGIRGTNREKHGANERNAVFRKFSRLLGLKVRQQLALGEYCLPPKVGELSKSQLREAYVHRAQVMGNHGCIAEMFEDFSEYQNLLSPTESMLRFERAGIALAVRIGWSYEAAGADWTDYMRRAVSLRGQRNGRPIVLAIAYGIFRIGVGYPGTKLQRILAVVRALRLTGRALFG